MMNINGMTNIEDVTNMIKDTIDNGDLEDAKDYLDQLNAYLNRPKMWVEPSKSQEEELKMPFPDARDQHLINRNFNKATGGK
tara:strand:+ start:305 stop:550 length:246 start_codon:yes stop_codon:yes gene_type:complete